jgi:hypothetical protein
MEASKVKFPSKLSAAQITILILGLITAFVHFGLFVRSGAVIMLLNSLGYLGLLVLYFVRFDFLPLKREWIRWAFIGFTAITFVAFFASWGMKSFSQPLGLVTKLVEAVLIFMLWRQK